MDHIIAIGGGQAGSSLVAKLRALGFAGRVTLICAEDEPPYQRPPLSKAYLLGQMERARLYLRPETFYAERDIDLRLGQPVTAIDASVQTVTVGDETLSYDALALTTGSTPRRLPAAIGGDLPGVYGVRTLTDVDGMAASFAPGKRAVIVGGGYIGLEAAAVARKLGLDVTLIEAAPRILQRVAAPETSAFFRNLHTDHGVDIREDTALARLAGTERVTGALLADGTEIPADFAIVGIGIVPDDGLARAAGLATDTGIVIDAHGRTSDPAIWAAGDCAVFPHRGAMIRLESVQNAIDQGEAVAANILGADTDYAPHPWFWSDQYDVKLQIAGLNTGYDRIVIRHGDDAALSHWYYGGDTLLAVDAMNDPRAFMVAKRLIEGGKSPAPSVIADSATDLKSLLRA